MTKNDILNIQRLRSIFTEIARELGETQLVYLFGSAVEGNRGPLSDYDFAVFHDRKAEGPELRGRLFHALALAMGTSRIDIVPLNKAPIELAFSVISHGEILYERDLQTRVEYEAHVMSMYFDHLPVLRAQRSDILKGAGHGTRVHRYREALGRTQRTLDAIRASQE
jgi:uncharacterized protein